MSGSPGRLLAISDLHVRHEENRRIVEGLRPTSDQDWLIVAGDVGELYADIVWALRVLRDRFAKVIWVPGNHELWTVERDPVRLRGQARYERLVEACREMGVLTPEDPFPVWEGEGGPVAIAPLFLLYDYSFWPEGADSTEAALKMAHAAGVVCTDEFLLHPDPYPSRPDWCADRLEISRRRLEELPEDLPTVLVNHWPMVREPTRVLWYPEFALWCGTEESADWHTRYRASAVVYGHLHIPRTIRVDGVPHYEVSVGYPREWRKRQQTPGRLVEILPAARPAGRA
ncbi:metallophosphoesterase [Streptomyces sp. NPDC005438]|uniref:metallophosphoesterase family protein n=1 Tax=Streptomyces sp. NPDC005438 TaxID=3156880 RepID=UPI00339FE96A